MKTQPGQAPEAEANSEESLSLLEQTSVLPAASGFRVALTRNTVLNVGRLGVTSLIALVLPSYLAHKLPVQTYSAWVLVLQMSAYVSYLDFGVQTGVAKYVAEYDARGDSQGANSRASAGFAIMLIASLLGVLMTLVLAWRVPHLFAEMPIALYPDVRRSLLFVGISLSFGLLCSTFSAVFMGLQRYDVPVGLSILNRLLFMAGVAFAVQTHSSLAVMGLIAAAVNVLTGLLQIVAWKKLASHIRLSLRHLDLAALRQMVRYCAVLAIWSAGMLCVSGLDVTIVGRYDFSQTAFYSIASLPTSFILAVLGAALGPLMPSASALSTFKTPVEMGKVLERTTRYSTGLLLVTGLPLIVAAYPLLRLWVGPVYALESMQYLRVLMAASILRNLCAPYATMMVALDSQKIAVAGAVAEAVVNLAGSLYLVRHIGAMGVALGTILGSIVSVFFHFALNMRRTYPKLSISSLRLLLTGVLRPGLMLIPSLLLLPLWIKAGPPSLSPLLWVLWAFSTAVLAWSAGLDVDARQQLLALARHAFRRPVSRPGTAALR